MAMEVHDAHRHDMDPFIKESACPFHDRQSRGHLSLSFCIQFLGNMLVLFFNVL
jgi:hypothetical protein